VTVLPKVEAFVRSPDSAGLFLDFDGTLSDIVHVPSNARPAEGARDAIEKLARRLALVAVVSGRATHQLVEWLGPEIEVWGVHGAERALGGSVVLTDRAAPYLEVMQLVRQQAEEKLAQLGLEGAILEDKGIMIGLHFRAAKDREHARAELDRLAQEIADEHGLIRAGGRLAFELRPPLEFTKAAVVLDRSREVGLKTVGFIGDDRVDLPGFDALDLLSREGLETLRVAVWSDEAPEELLDRADLVLDGPAEVVRFLRGLGAD
jgi:trehalose 6-phosphate phosphatase